MNSVNSYTLADDMGLEAVVHGQPFRTHNQLFTEPRTGYVVLMARAHNGAGANDLTIEHELRPEEARAVAERLLRNAEECETIMQGHRGIGTRCNA